MKEAQQFFEANDFEHCYDTLRQAYDISTQIKDKDAQKFIKARMEEVDKRQKNDFIEKLTSTFRSGNKGKRTQEEIIEGLASTVEVVMNGAFALEDKLLSVSKTYEEKITLLEERLGMREKLSEAMAEQIGTLTQTINELKDVVERLKSTATAQPASAPMGMQQQPIMGMQQQPMMGMQQQTMMQPNPIPPSQQGFVPPPGMSPQKLSGPPSLPPGSPPPGMGPPVSKTPVEKKMPDNPMNLRGSLISELEGALAKRRKAMDE